MQNYYVKVAGDLVYVRENIEYARYMLYQDSMIMMSLSHLSEAQKLKILRYIVKLSKGRILEKVPMKLPEKDKESEEFYLDKCETYGRKQYNKTDYEVHIVSPYCVDIPMICK